MDENPNCEKTEASFRVMGDDLRVGEVTEALGVHPTWAAERGEIVRGGGPRTQPTGVWAFGSEGRLSSTSLERHLVLLLDEIEPASLPLARLRRRRCLTVDFVCLWASRTGHGGPDLSAAVLGRIAALDAGLTIDFYDSDDERGGHPGPFGGAAGPSLPVRG